MLVYICFLIYFSLALVNCQKPCSSNPCLNNAVCTNKSNKTYTCKCRIGYTGNRCENIIAACESNPCKNNAICSEYLGNYYCRCPTDFTGKNCQTKIFPCVKSKCKNNATCYQIANGKQKCECKGCFWGEFCEINSDPCTQNPCANGGTCRNNLTSCSAVCECTNKYYGAYCNYLRPPCDDENPKICNLFIGYLFGQRICNLNIFGLDFTTTCKSSCNLCPGSNSNCFDDTVLCSYFSYVCGMLDGFDNLCKRTCGICS